METGGDEEEEGKVDANGADQEIDESIRGREANCGGNGA